MLAESFKDFGVTRRFRGTHFEYHLTNLWINNNLSKLKIQW